MRVNLRTVPGASLTQDMLREDVRAIWRMGFFEDVQVEANNDPGGVAVVFVLKEKPSIKKIYVAGNDEVGLTKINEVLDIKKEQILDLAKIKKNVEKIRELYLQRGFYMADVTYELKRVGPPRSTSASASAKTPRSRCGGSTSWATRRPPTASCAR